VDYHYVLRRSAGPNIMKTAVEVGQNIILLGNRTHEFVLVFASIRLCYEWVRFVRDGKGPPPLDRSLDQ
jgi:hypothetical protein